MLKSLCVMAAMGAACGQVAFAASHGIPEMDPQHWYDPSVPCGAKHDERLMMTCKQDRAVFAAEMQLAFRGDYQGQQNLVYYYSTGSEGAVMRAPLMACAWNTVIITDPPENMEYYGGDLQLEARQMLRHCDPLDRADALLVPTIVQRILNQIEELSPEELQELRDELRPKSPPAACVTTDTCPPVTVKPAW